MLAVTQPAVAARASAVAYFQFDVPPDTGRVIFMLTDPARITEARNIIKGLQTDRIHVKGTIVKSPARYNPGWSYHLDPASVVFFSNAVEVCDATPSYVQAHLAEVGGSFLPGNVWCPWRSRLLREVPALS